MNPLNAYSRCARASVVALSLAMPLTGVLTASADTLAAPEPNVLPFTVLEGKPEFNDVDDAGYWLWHDENGLHLRTTTRGLPHRFIGVIRTREHAAFYNVSLIRDEQRPRNRNHSIQVDNDLIRFRLTTYDGIDGLDFRLNGEGFCVDLNNNGHNAEGNVYLGAAETAAGSIPVCFKR